ncbi:MAG: SnoaL-like domain [Blastocatellia bacterium]|jgi:ketosteroid isomerase-like protein|nr:SnoaL-like domain [Blastocatellia bacterium]
MLKKTPLFIFLLCALAATVCAQNANSSTTTTTTTRARTSTKTTKPPSKPSNIEEQGTQGETSNQNASRTRRTRTTPQSGAKDPGAKGVLAAFEELLNGIRNTDVEAVTAAYWNSPQLVLFNNNGTVTKGWEQMRKNRESSYPELKDVKLDVRDVRVQMLGREGAIVTCLWTQSQTYHGASETATGRMTLAFRRVGNTWKAIHLHTSPDSPDPSRLLPSEQIPTPAPKTPAPRTKP